MNRIVNQCYKRNGPNSWLFHWFLSSSFGDHANTYICVSLYTLFEYEMKTGLWTITLCSQDIPLLRKHKNNSKVDYSYNRNWWTAGYGDLIIGTWGSGKGAVFGIDFPQNICGYDLFHHPFTLQELYVTALFYTMYML